MHKQTYQPPLMLTVEQAATLAQISRRHAYQMVNEGVLPSVRFGRAIRIPRDRLLELIDSRGEPC
jgi:excisionase family DNA binding protein